MNNEKMKNTVVLKNLPSNIIEEAIIILKSNKYAKRIEKIDKNNKSSFQEEKGKNKDFVVREAEMLIANYVDRMEENKNKSYKSKTIEKKFKILRMYSIVLSVSLFISLIINLIK